MFTFALLSCVVALIGWPTIQKFSQQPQDNSDQEIPQASSQASLQASSSQSASIEQVLTEINLQSNQSNNQQDWLSTQDTILMTASAVPIPAEATPVDPTPVDPTPVDPTPVDPIPVDPTPVQVDVTQLSQIKYQMPSRYDKIQSVFSQKNISNTQSHTNPNAPPNPQAIKTIAIQSKPKKRNQKPKSHDPIEFESIIPQKESALQTKMNQTHEKSWRSEATEQIKSSKPHDHPRNRFDFIRYADHFSMKDFYLHFEDFFAVYSLIYIDQMNEKLRKHRSSQKLKIDFDQLENFKVETEEMLIYPSKNQMSKEEKRQAQIYQNLLSSPYYPTVKTPSLHTEINLEHELADHIFQKGKPK